MFDVTAVFAKVFVREFYRLNAGFFMIIVTLTFGFMSGVEHKALAQFFVASPTLTCIPIAVWTLYSLKVIGFNRQRIAMSENNFLHATPLLSYPRQLIISTQALFLQFTPVTLYGLFLTIIGLKHGAIKPVVMIIGSIAVLLFLASHALIGFLKTPIREPTTPLLKRLIDRHFVRPLWWIYLTATLRKEPVLFIGTKVFGGVLLFAVTRLYENESFDARLLAMAATVAGVANYMITMQLQLFDLHSFQLMKNLPVRTTVRWLRIVLVVGIAVLPEIILLSKYGPAIHAMDFASILLLVPSVAMTAYSLLYLSFREESTYSRLIFTITMGHIVVILFQVSAGILVAANLVTSWLIFQRKYYAFEYSVGVKE